MSIASPRELGLGGSGRVYLNQSVPGLVAEAIRRGEGTLTGAGALEINTGKYTGRSPDDKFIVDLPQVHDEIAWGEINRPISAERFSALKARVLAYLEGRDLFVFDGIGGADSSASIRFRVINEFAAQNLFIHQLLIRPSAAQLKSFTPDYTMICAPGFKCQPERDGVHSEAAIIVDFVSRTVLIAGSSYCGEIKKSVFTVMNYELPKKGILPMHCSANMDESGSTALFFGLSGTGKTTLSSSSGRILIGDDEHGWSDKSVFNIEGGCYAKCIDLEREKEPEIYDAIRFGSVLENVILNEDGDPDYNDHSLTFNTRAGYPINYIHNASLSGVGNVPSVIIFLTADAFGVVPPISRLDINSALYHYISGYTSKVSGTEIGITEPVTTFSTMFGAPFFPHKTKVYTELMAKKLAQSKARIYLVNTGWCGGQAGAVPRIKLSYTRALVAAAISGELDRAKYERDPVLNLDVPDSCPGVPSEILSPANLWGDKSEYDRQVRLLARRFSENFAKKFSELPEEISGAGPRV